MKKAVRFFIGLWAAFTGVLLLNPPTREVGIQFFIVSLGVGLVCSLVWLFVSLAD